MSTLRLLGGKETKLANARFSYFPFISPEIIRKPEVIKKWYLKTVLTGSEICINGVGL